MVVGAGCMVTLMSAMSGLSTWCNSGLAVGAMIAFQAGPAAPAAGIPRLIVETTDGGLCAIDLGVVQHAGGSLMIEGRAPDATERIVVHWVGRRTAADGLDCGQERLLIVDRPQLDTLGLAAATGHAVPPDKADEDAAEQLSSDRQHPA